ncbi:peptidyl-prolyl cis-trans isomerase 1 [Elysia marginata]|uniref:peptidylprolyl isomerase n=1 Tax=Elysia marginata TaxID=1093978 RepID=A0AAV4JSD2_9GAST|nr:peptidyl-prolyl cis-trans isomerase 1 [Elysia marginata]
MTVGGHRPRCFFDISIGEQEVGRIVFELFSDVCPKTCENFRALCTGELGTSEKTGNTLHYKGALFHRVVKDFVIQGGDFTKSTCHSIINTFVVDKKNHPNRTTKSAPHLDGIHVVFGQVLTGQDVVRAIETLLVDSKSRPTSDVKISNCGELVLQLKSKSKKKAKAESHSSDSGSEKETKKKKKKKHHHKRKHKKKESKKRKKDKKSKASADEEEEEKEKKAEDGEDDEGKPKEEDKEEPPNSMFADIRKDEIPDVPFQNFLYRGKKAEEAEATKEKEKEDQSSSGKRRDSEEGKRNGTSPRRSRGGRYNRQIVSASGRKLKGRGAIRFRSRSRSTTPPHWKQEQRRAIPLHEAEKIADRRQNRKEMDGIDEGGDADGGERRWSSNRREGREPLSRRFERGRGDAEEAHNDNTKRSLENGRLSREKRDREDVSKRGDARHEERQKRARHDDSDEDKGKAEKRMRKESKKTKKSVAGPRDQSEDSDIEEDSGDEDKGKKSEATARSNREKERAKERSREARNRRESERAKSRSRSSSQEEKAVMKKEKSPDKRKTRDSSSPGVRIVKRQTSKSKRETEKEANSKQATAHSSHRGDKRTRRKSSASSSSDSSDEEEQRKNKRVKSRGSPVVESKKEKQASRSRKRSESPEQFRSKDKKRSPQRSRSRDRKKSRSPGSERPWLKQGYQQSRKADRSPGNRKRRSRDRSRSRDDKKGSTYQKRRNRSESSQEKGRKSKEENKSSGRNRRRGKDSSSSSSDGSDNDNQARGGKRSIFQKNAKKKSESPPPTHWKPGQKPLKNAGRPDVSEKANPLDEAPLSILQETEAMLKAQLAADSVDEALNITPGSGNPPSASVANLLSSAKISYKLDSGSAIQYSVTTGEPFNLLLQGGQLSFIEAYLSATVANLYGSTIP